MIPLRVGLFAVLLVAPRFGGDHQEHREQSNSYRDDGMLLPRFKCSSITSTMVYPYWSTSWVWSVMSFLETSSEETGLARVPQAWPSSGQSMPPTRMRAGCWLCRTSRVSLTTETIEEGILFDRDRVRFFPLKQGTFSRNRDSGRRS